MTIMLASVVPTRRAGSTEDDLLLEHEMRLAHCGHEDHSIDDESKALLCSHSCKLFIQGHDAMRLEMDFGGGRR